jgi:hypothetical protein
MRTSPADRLWQIVAGACGFSQDAKLVIPAGCRSVGNAITRVAPARRLHLVRTSHDVGADPGDSNSVVLLFVILALVGMTISFVPAYTLPATGPSLSLVSWCRFAGSLFMLGDPDRRGAVRGAGGCGRGVAGGELARA